MTNGLKVWTLTDKSKPTALTDFHYTDPATGLTSVLGSTNTSVDIAADKNKNYLYVAHWGGTTSDANNLEIFDLNNPNGITLLGMLPLASSTTIRNIHVVGTLLYLQPYSSGKTQIIDVSNPQSPRLMSHRILGDTTNTLAVAGGRMFASVFDSNSSRWELQVYAVENPELPRLIQTFPTDNAFIKLQARSADTGFTLFGATATGIVKFTLTPQRN